MGNCLIGQRVMAEGGRQQFPQVCFCLLVGIGIEQQEREIGREFDQELPADSAGCDTTPGGDRHGGPLALSGGQSGSGGHAFGADGRAVRRIFNVAAGKGLAGGSYQRGTDVELAVRCVGAGGCLAGGGGQCQERVVVEHGVAAEMRRLLGIHRVVFANQLGRRDRFLTDDVGGRQLIDDFTAGVGVAVECGQWLAGLDGVTDAGV